jgi:chorismate mutase
MAKLWFHHQPTHPSQAPTLSMQQEVEIAHAVEQLQEVVVRNISTSEETFVECLICGDVDSHKPGCWVAGALEWLDVPLQHQSGVK